MALARRRAAWGDKQTPIRFMKTADYKLKGTQGPVCRFSLRRWAHHAQVLPVLVLADDVPQAVERGAGVLVDGDLLVGGGRLVLACGWGDTRYNTTV